MLLDGLTDTLGPALGCEASPAATGNTPVAPADITAPTVVTRTPAAGATAVARSTRPTATSSEPVAGISAGTVQLRDAKGVSIRATVAYDATRRTATLTPAAALRSRTTYNASLSGSIADTAGNTLTATSWSFTAGSK